VAGKDPDRALSAVGATADGGTTAYDDASLGQVSSDDAFADHVCRAVTGT
jgi:hypothetical protein